MNGFDIASYHPAMQPKSAYLHLTKAERSGFLYRIMSLDRLFQMFAERANYLVRPIMWEDPFENFIAHLQGKLPTGEVVELAQRFDFFGQCWTLRGGTDAMWRIYSPDKRSARIKVRLPDLFTALSTYAIGVPFIGKVKYLRLKPWAQRLVRSTSKPSLELLAKTFLAKRPAFSHENEVRLLYCSDRDSERGRVYRHPFDCHRLIAEITLDPRLDKIQAKKLGEEIRVRTRYKGRIVQSNLYAPPKQFFVRLGASYAALVRTKARVSYERDLRRTISRPDGISQLVLPPL